MYKSASSNDYHAGQQAGQRELHEVLADAAQRQKDPLSTRQLHFLYIERVLLRGNQVDLHTRLGEWFAGWCAGMLSAYLEAETAALTSEQLSKHLSSSPSSASDHFLSACYREAKIHAANVYEFFDGIQQGLNAQANDEHQMTVAHLFQVLIVDLSRPFAIPLSQDHLVGYLIGRVDALLRNRQYAPVGWSERDGGTCP